MSVDRHEAECARVEAEFNGVKGDLGEPEPDLEQMNDEYVRLECLRISGGHLSTAEQMYRFVKGK